MAMYIKFVEGLNHSAKASCLGWVASNAKVSRITAAPKFYWVDFNGQTYDAPTVRKLTALVWAANPK